jgi:RsiW-degrading membrane proteinase PrsW (M82 family)
MGILYIILLSFLPAALYAFIVYVTVPYKTIKFKTGLTFLIGGFLSVGLLLYFFQIFPEWTNLAANLVNGYQYPLHYVHIENFLQIGFIEELSKLGTFFLIANHIKNKGDAEPHPLATMFYVGMVSLGFAVIENISYGTHSITPYDTIMWRSITSVIGHMVFGMFMGYWIALGRLGVRLKNRSILDIAILKKPKLRRRLFVFIGLMAATILHGLYDLHITITGVNGISTLYMLLIMSVLGVFWCFKNLTKVHNEKLEERVDN